MPASIPHRPAGKYRPDIDGLRAVAVLLVVFNHLKLGWPGGFVGVDVFFVISGYLIGGVILSELRAGKFSIVNFYERRIRRIFPALFIMLLVTSVLAYHYLLPLEAISFARSLLATLGSASNILFFHQASYFDVASETKPLLHTWSLGVEEQFYVFCPLFLMAVYSWFPHRVRAALYTVTTVTLCLSAIFVHRDAASAAFFLAPLRAWELLLGAIVSESQKLRLNRPVQRNLASLAGLFLILIPALLYDERTRFPGFRALPPCFGAMFVILAGASGRSFVWTFLSWRPIVFIGMISYSLYLWHWPLIVFLNASLLLHDTPHPLQERIGSTAILVVSLAVATLSWRFVETPFRTGRFRPGRRTLFIVSGVAAGIIVGIGSITTETNGLAGRFSPEVVRADGYSAYDAQQHWGIGQCFLNDDSNFASFNKMLCLRDDPSRKHYLLYGDSHAADLYTGLSTVFPEVNMSQATVHGCPPLWKQRPYPPADCLKMSEYIFEDYLPHHHVDLVLLSARWTKPQLPNLAETVALIKQHGIEPVVIGPRIEFDRPLPQLIAISLRDSRPPGWFSAYFESQTRELDDQMRILARTQWKVRYISVFEDLCTSQLEMVAKSQPESASGCPIYSAPGVPLLRDQDHFSGSGSVLFARAMRSRQQIPE